MVNRNSDYCYCNNEKKNIFKKFFVSVPNSHWHENLAFDILDQAQILVPGSTQGTI
jgi:hypothetical protein